jgi:hypothetical protein
MEEVQKTLLVHKLRAAVEKYDPSQEDRSWRALTLDMAKDMLLKVMTERAINGCSTLVASITDSPYGSVNLYLGTTEDPDSDEKIAEDLVKWLISEGIYVEYRKIVVPLEVDEYYGTIHEGYSIYSFDINWQ